MKKYKICMTTYFDKNFEKLGQLTLKSMKRYAKRHGFDIKLFNDLVSDRPPAWNKILIMQKVFDLGYDFVFWIDSDAVIVGEDDIRKEIIDEKDFYLVKHFVKGRDAPNTGVVLLRNSKWGRDFLKDVWAQTEFINHRWWENAAINYLLGFSEDIKESKIKQIVKGFLYKVGLKNFVTKVFVASGLSGFIARRKKMKRLKREAVGDGVKKVEHKSKYLDKVRWMDLRWNSLPGRLDVENPVINHYPARPFEERLEKMGRDLTAEGSIYVPDKIISLN